MTTDVTRTRIAGAEAGRVTPGGAGAGSAVPPAPVAQRARKQPAARLGRVVVGVDDTPGGVAALRWAADLARSSPAPLVAVRCWAPGLPRHGGRRHRHDRHRRMALSYPGTVARAAAAALMTRVFHDAVGGVPDDLAVRAETPRGDPGVALVSLANRDDDALVVGTARPPRGQGHPRLGEPLLLPPRRVRGDRRPAGRASQRDTPSQP